MNRHAQKQKLAGPWRNIHAGIWMIGLAILFLKGWWWPGILFLVAFSMVLEGLLKQVAPQAFENEGQPYPPAPVAPVAPAPRASAPVAPATAFATSPAAAYHPVELLPSLCPRCGGPVRGHEVKWTGSRSASCAYCGANLPLKKA
jgi:hypothetical protein